MLLKGAGRHVVSGGSAPLTFAQLVTNYSPLQAWDAMDATTLYQETSRSTLAGVDVAVKGIADKSGNNRHGQCFTTGGIHRQSGAMHYLELNVSHSFWGGDYTNNQPMTRISVIRQTSWASGRCIFGGSNSLAGGKLVQTGTTPAISLHAGSNAASNTDATLNTDFCIVEKYDGASSSLRVGTATATTGNPGSTGAGGFSLASDEFGNNKAALYFYRVMIFAGNMADADVTIVRDGLSNGII